MIREVESSARGGDSRRESRALLGALASAPWMWAGKAKTNEQMGFIGRAEGIAAYAAVLLEETERE